MKLFLKYFNETIVNKKIPTNGGEIVIKKDIIFLLQP
jgi:hypothetical protein